VVQDLLPNALTERAAVVLPGAAWTEKEGCWENFAGRIQPFFAAVAPPETVMREGDAYDRLLGRTGLYSAEAVRREMGEPFASVQLPVEGPEPAVQFEAL
jgi:NADH dehydrogenase/NADH:ubiquinone oxidoreductase subunit G